MCLPLPKNPEEVVVFRLECAVLCPDPIVRCVATRIYMLLVCGLLLNAVFEAICTK